MCWTESEAAQEAHEAESPPVETVSCWCRVCEEEFERPEGEALLCPVCRALGEPL